MYFFLGFDSSVEDLLIEVTSSTSEKSKIDSKKKENNFSGDPFCSTEESEFKTSDAESPQQLTSKLKSPKRGTLLESQSVKWGMGAQTQEDSIDSDITEESYSVFNTLFSKKKQDDVLVDNQSLLSHEKPMKKVKSPAKRHILDMADQSKVKHISMIGDFPSENINNFDKDVVTVTPDKKSLQQQGTAEKVKTKSRLTLSAKKRLVTPVKMNGEEQNIKTICLDNDNIESDKNKDKENSMIEFTSIKTRSMDSPKTSKTETLVTSAQKRYTFRRTGSLLKQGTLDTLKNENARNRERNSGEKNVTEMSTQCTSSPKLTMITRSMDSPLCETSTARQIKSYSGNEQRDKTCSAKKSKTEEHKVDHNEIKMKNPSPARRLFVDELAEKKNLCKSPFSPPKTSTVRYMVSPKKPQLDTKDQHKGEQSESEEGSVISVSSVTTRRQSKRLSQAGASPDSKSSRSRRRRTISEVSSTASTPSMITRSVSKANENRKIEINVSPTESPVKSKQSVSDWLSNESVFTEIQTYSRRRSMPSSRMSESRKSINEKTTPSASSYRRRPISGAASCPRVGTRQSQRKGGSNWETLEETENEGYEEEDTPREEKGSPRVCLNYKAV